MTTEQKFFISLVYPLLLGLARGIWEVKANSSDRLSDGLLKSILLNMGMYTTVYGIVYYLFTEISKGH